MLKTSTYKTPIIKCPHCGAEYLAGELYLPGSLIGQPDEVIRDSFGKIIYEDYYQKTSMPDMIEHFICEYCDKPFVVEATVTYKAKEERPERDFKRQYVSLID